MKQLLTNKNYLILLVCIGGLLGFTNAFVATVTQIACPYGYEDEFVGLTITLLLFAGVVGGAIASLTYQRLLMPEEQAKIIMGINGIIQMPVFVLTQEPDQEYLLASLLVM